MTCPQPDKVRYPTKARATGAQKAWEIRNGPELGLRPYKCGDHWHLGHRNKNASGTLETRIRRALGRKR